MAININSPGFVDKQQGRADEEGQGRVERRTASLFKAILFFEQVQETRPACLSLRRKRNEALFLRTPTKARLLSFPAKSFVDKQARLAINSP